MEIGYGEHNHIVTCVKDYFIECYDGETPAFAKGEWYLADKIINRFKIYHGTTFKIFDENLFAEYFVE